jgi:hypothetical protein
VCTRGHKILNHLNPYFQYSLYRYQEKDYLLEKFEYNNITLAEFNMSVWQPVIFGMLPLGAKPINPPPDLEPVEEYSSRTFRLHVGDVDFPIQRIGVGSVGFFFVASSIVVAVFRKMGRARRRSHKP